MIVDFSKQFLGINIKNPEGSDYKYTRVIKQTQDVYEGKEYIKNIIKATPDVKRFAQEILDTPDGEYYNGSYSFVSNIEEQKPEAVDAQVANNPTDTLNDDLPF